jgi:hypothetical protein
MIRGVNVGNWLVLEKWMSPKLFEGTDAEDEFYLCADLDEADPDQARGSEPVPTEFLCGFYTEAYHRIRAHSDDVIVVFHDGFRVRELADFFSTASFAALFPLIIGEWCIDTTSTTPSRLQPAERAQYYRRLAAAQLAAWEGAEGLVLLELQAARRRLQSRRLGHGEVSRPRLSPRGPVIRP